MALFLAEELEEIDRLHKLAKKYNINLTEGSIKLKESSFVDYKEYTEEFCLSYIKSGKDEKLINFILEYFYDEKLLRGSQPMKVKNCTTGIKLELDSLSSSMRFFVTALINAKKGIYTLMRAGVPSYRFLKLMNQLPLDFQVCYERTDQEIQDENNWKDVKIAVDNPVYIIEKHKLEVANYIEYNMGISYSEDIDDDVIDLTYLDDETADFSVGIRVRNHIKGEMPDIDVRRAFLLGIEIKENGEYIFKTGLSRKYPKLCDIIYEFGVSFIEEEQCGRDVLYSERAFNGDKNILVIVVDVEETIARLEDINYAKFGFLYKDNVLHIHNRDNALCMLAERLKASASPKEIAKYLGDADFIGTLWTADEIESIHGK